MSYQEARTRLENMVEHSTFIEDVRANNLHASRRTVRNCANGTVIYITFPGYKADITTTPIKYDYKVCTQKGEVDTGLSHVNIILDIYNKIRHGRMSPMDLRNELINIAETGNINLPQAIETLTYTPINMTEEHRTNGNTYLMRYGIRYNQEGNLSDLTIEELFFNIKWITLQEDINYPMPRYQGRKMPFYRYLEAIHYAENNLNIGLILRRAHRTTPPPPLLTIDYSRIDSIQR